MAARLGFAHHGGGGVERLDKVLKIGALAADMKTQPFHNQSHRKRRLDQIHRFAGGAAELGGEFACEPVLSTRRRSTTPACGANCLIFFSSFRLS